MNPHWLLKPFWVYLANSDSTRIYLRQTISQLSVCTKNRSKCSLIFLLHFAGIFLWLSNQQCQQTILFPHLRSIQSLVKCLPWQSLWSPSFFQEKILLYSRSMISTSCGQAESNPSDKSTTRLLTSGHITKKSLSHSQPVWTIASVLGVPHKGSGLESKLLCCLGPLFFKLFHPPLDIFHDVSSSLKMFFCHGSWRRFVQDQHKNGSFHCPPTMNRSSK
jgi:hypothetical protein